LSSAQMVMGARVSVAASSLLLSWERILLPSQDELRHYTSDDALDHSNPRRRHFMADVCQRALAGSRSGSWPG